MPACRVCKATFASPAALKGHLASSPACVVIVCAACKTIFPTKGELGTHLAASPACTT